LKVHWMAAGSPPAGEERVRLKGMAEPLGALPVDKDNCDCARRVFPNSNGRNRARMTLGSRLFIGSVPVVPVLEVKS